MCVCAHSQVSIYLQLKPTPPQDCSPASREYRLRTIEFGGHEMDTWYHSPFPVEYTQISKIYVCQFCLKYFKSSLTLHKHAVGQRVVHQG